MKILLTNDKGEALACECKKCGAFSLDTKTGLCASCSLIKFLMSSFVCAHEDISRGGDD